MADRPRFRTVFYKLAPSWLTTEDGERVLYSLGLVEDMWMERLRQGLNARFPERAPSDALPIIGRDRRIVKGFVEDDATYASRLLRWLDDWKTAGNPFALMQQIKAYSGATKLRTVDQRGNWFTLDGDNQAYVFDQGNWNWDGTPATDWSRFWVIIYSETGPWARDGEWGDGDVWADDATTWGSTASREEVTSIRAIVHEWKAAHAKCEKILVSFDDALFDPLGASVPDGSWGDWSEYSGGVQVPSRHQDAIYWDC